MATNRYFKHNVRSEQKLYEDLIVESLKFYGQDVYYVPREVVRKDMVFDDVSLSRFKHAYKIEIYIENIDGWDGDGDLFSKFGVEIRQAATFVLARRRWNQEIATRLDGDDNLNYRPREGDLIHIPMSNSTFEIMNVEKENPFYQLGQLPVFKMRCELFEYSDEDFDTNIPAIDKLEEFAAYQYVLTMDSSSSGYAIGETITQTFADYVISGEVVQWSDSDDKLYLTHVGSNDGVFRQFSTSLQIIGQESNAVATPTLVEELQNIQGNSPGGAFSTVDDWDITAADFIDWSESNPFGDPN